MLTYKKREEKQEQEARKKQGENGKVTIPSIPNKQKFRIVVRIINWRFRRTCVLPFTDTMPLVKAHGNVQRTTTCVKSLKR